MNKNKRFCVMFATKNYYPMFEGCLYKYTKADYDDVLILNVDIDSDEESKKEGIKICESHGIKFVNPDKNYTSFQESIKAADEYLLENDIDVD